MGVAVRLSKQLQSSEVILPSMNKAHPLNTLMIGEDEKISEDFLIP